MDYVPYYRVSTAGQGKSGLGLSAQREIVSRFVKTGDQLLLEFVEIESGKRADRPQLTAAIAHAKQHGARLLIANLDRLSRNMSFIFSPRNSEVDFVACDIPDANTLTVGIMAVLAQHERELIGERTRAALQAKKAQGFKLGTPNLVAATVALAQEVGWEKTSVREIAKRVGSSTIKIYTEYGSKDALLLEVQKRGFQQLKVRYERALAVEVSAQVRLVGLSAAHCRFAREHKTHYDLMFSINGAVCKADTREVLRDASQPIRQALHAASGRTDHVVFVNWWALVHGFTLVAVSAGLANEAAQETMLTQLIENLIKGLR